MLPISHSRALPEDALVEPRIAAECERMRDVTDETTDYLLNGPGGPCAFLDQRTSLCGIYDTRPLMCRLFDCQAGFRDELVELGILPPRDSVKR
jgi:Fe-S-cluster containining protein